MLKICSGGMHKDSHDEIIYEGRNCPLCEAMEKIIELELEIEALQNKEGD